jgi:aminoglycoside phosphotransferase (APT) family kinase protein
MDHRQLVPLLAEQFPPWAGLALTRVRSVGTDNSIYRLGTDLSVRLPRHAAAARAIEKERRWLPRLGPLLPLEIPVPVGHGVPAHGYLYPWAVYRWLNGTNLVEAAEAPSDVDLHDVAGRLGRFVAALHRIDPAGGPPSFRGGPVRDLDDRVRREIDDLPDAGRLREAWESTLAAPAWSGRPVWLHADLYPTNLLAVAGRLSAVIDFGGLGVADPACDTLPAWALLTPSTRPAFRAEVDVDEATWVCGRGWALALGIGAAHFYQVTNPVLAAVGRHTIAEVLGSASQ